MDVVKLYLAQGIYTLFIEKTWVTSLELRQEHKNNFMDFLLMYMELHLINVKTMETCSSKSQGATSVFDMEKYAR